MIGARVTISKEGRTPTTSGKTIFTGRRSALARDTTDQSKWKYDAFSEPKTEKNPTTIDIKLVPKYKGATIVIDPLIPDQIRAMSVFNHLVSFHSHGTGNAGHAPTNADYDLAWQYAKWKYGINTANLDSITYD